MDRGEAEPNRLLVGGISAAGGLVVSTLVAVGDAGDPLPVAPLSLSPVTDCGGSAASLVANASREPVFHESARHHQALCLAGADPRNPLASPTYADLRALPPPFIQVGSAEMLLDDATGFAERATAAGLSAKLDIWAEIASAVGTVPALLQERWQASCRR